MRFSTLGLWSGLAASAMAEDLLFLDGMDYREYDEAVAMGFTTKKVTPEEWAAMKTEDFAKFKALVIPDPSCGSLSDIKFFEDSKSVWSPAITGNIILIGTFEDALIWLLASSLVHRNGSVFPFLLGQGSNSNRQLHQIRCLQHYAFWCSSDWSILRFVLLLRRRGQRQGRCRTSLHYASQWRNTKCAQLSYFGDFTVRGNLDCYNKVHLVASSDAMASLDDASLSDWSCSVHEAFASYPSVGTNGFQALAIAQDILGVGSQTFGDKSVGLPYIISRGATPAKCGDGVWDKDLGEECDDGNTKNGDGCSLSCKCESGKPNGDGTCAGGNTTLPSGGTGVKSSSTPYSSSYISTGKYPNGTSSYPSGPSSVYSTPSGVSSSPSGVYTSPSGVYSSPSGVYTGPSGVYTGPSGYSTPDGTHHTTSYATPTYYTSGYVPYTTPVYVTPACPTGPKIIGVEYIVEVTYSVSTYVPCSTHVRPIYDVSTSILPCYACAMSTEHVTYVSSTDFVTVTTTTCKETAVPTTYWPPVVKPCKKCEEHTFTHTECIGEAHTEYTPMPYVTPTPHTHTHIDVTDTHTHTYANTYTYANYPGATFTTYPTPTGTNYYPSATTGIVEFTGAAVPKEVRAAGLVGGALVALAGLL